jgi:hypothetical protein
MDKPECDPQRKQLTIGSAPTHYRARWSAQVRNVVPARYWAGQPER